MELKALCHFGSESSERGGRVEEGRATVVITEEIYKRKTGMASSTSSLNCTICAINSVHCSLKALYC